MLISSTREPVALAVAIAASRRARRSGIASRGRRRSITKVLRPSCATAASRIEATVPTMICPPPSMTAWMLAHAAACGLASAVTAFAGGGLAPDPPESAVTFDRNQRPSSAEYAGEENISEFRSAIPRETMAIMALRTANSR